MSLRASLAFFTRLPAGRPDPPPPLEGVMAWLPAVGVVVGLLSGAAVWMASLVLPPAICGILGCLAWAAVTGGLHLDGVADCGDGLLMEASPERRLEVMRDPRLGTFGAVALFLVLALKAASLGLLAENAARTGRLIPLIWACCLAGTAGRCLALAAAGLPSARPGGLGDTARRGLSRRHAAVAVLAAIVLAASGGVAGLAALVAACAVGAGVLLAAVRRLGGVTGDVCGCVIEAGECAVLCALCAG